MIKLDRGQTATERVFADVERRLKRNYRQAMHEVQQKMDEFNAKFKDADRQNRRLLSEGKITKQDYDAWLRGQVFRGEQWRKKRDQITESLYQADTISQRIVNGERIGVFASNRNYMAYAMETGEGVNFGFGVYDNATVANLLKNQPNLLPPRTVKRKADVEWYHKIVNNCVTQGIIQGEGIPAIAKRIAQTTGERGYNAAVRNARTAMTSAQNAGRIEMLHEAQDMGIKVKKRWLATLDDRTRDAHADLDGQVQKVDDYFESSLGPILFPGDPSAEPANVYNCRCTLIYEHPEYPSDIPRLDNINGEVIEDMTYWEWESAKEAEAQKSSLVQRVEKSLGESAVTGRGVEKQVDYSQAMPISEASAPTQTPTPVEIVPLSNAELEKKSQKWLEKETARLAAKWYKTGKTGITFPPGTNLDKAAQMLASGKSKAQLIKDYKALRRRLK